MLSGQVIDPVWPAPQNVRSLCTTRNGGMSHRPFDSLNLAAHVGDEPRRVQENRRLLVAELGLPREPAWLDQQHTGNVVCIDNAGSGEMPPVPADAAYASQPGRVCAVMTADCLPVLICDADGTRVAAIHAGWRGLALGIIEATAGMLDPGRRHLYAWLGPAIGPQAYEIDEVVRSQLLAADNGAQGAFQSTRQGHWTVDLYELARRRLRRAGVNDIYGGDFCTYSEPERFYSYRRDEKCGRQASLIWLED